MNLTDEDLRFIVAVKDYAKKKPHMVSALVEVIQDGINEAFKEATELAADMETMAAMALNARLFKGNETFIADKLEKWKGKTAIRWDDQLSALRSKTK